MGHKRDLKRIKCLVIHCAATPNGKWYTNEDIDLWHEKRKFKRNMSLAPHHEPNLIHIGYHYVIYTTGAVRCGRPLYESGAHVRGHNINSIGTCLIGTDKFTSMQWQTLALHVDCLRRQFRDIEIVGHRDLSPDIDGDGTVEPHEWLKICPGFSVRVWIKNKMQPTEDQICEIGD